jgi:hypothetical protein
VEEQTSKSSHRQRSNKQQMLEQPGEEPWSSSSRWRRKSGATRKRWRCHRLAAVPVPAKGDDWAGRSSDSFWFHKKKLGNSI